AVVNGDIFHRTLLIAGVMPARNRLAQSCAGTDKDLTLWWEQRSQPRLSLCQEYRVRDPSLLIACERLAAMSALPPKADIPNLRRVIATTESRSRQVRRPPAVASRQSITDVYVMYKTSSPVDGVRCDSSSPSI